ncbi:hypothetical protein Tco_0169090 [Tanacetum coccineum]
MCGEELATQIAPVESPQMVSIIKLPILKKGEYTLWSMRMEQYLTNTNYSLWQVILNGDDPIQVTTDEKGVETKVPPKSAQALLARQRERKAKSIILLAILDEYQLKFHAIKDAKTPWAAIKSRFGGNVESKKMQKNVLKQQFENFSVSDIEGLDKVYDRNKDSIDDLDIDDLYNNLKLFKVDIKGSFGSSSNSHNVAFLSAEDTSSSNEVNIANGKESNQEIREEELEMQGIGAGTTPKDCTRNTVETSDHCLESIEAQLVVHQKNEVVNEEKITVLEFEVKDKSNAITRLKKQLDETLREKDDLKAKL